MSFSLKVYNPEDHGARCSECFLVSRREGPPVGPEMNEGAKIYVLGEAPGETEVKQDSPFTGKSGGLLWSTLIKHGVRRGDCAISNVLLCRPKDNKLDVMMAQWKAANKGRAKWRRANGFVLGKDGVWIGKDGTVCPNDYKPMPSPMDCCKPRMDKELEQFENVLPLGKVAIQAVLEEKDEDGATAGGGASMFDIRGGPIERVLLRKFSNFVGDGIRPFRQRILPALHPSFVLRKRGWLAAFNADIARAVRWFVGGALDWRVPEPNLKPSPAEVWSYFRSSINRQVTFDCETGPPYGKPDWWGKEPLLADLRCIGFFNEELGGMVIPLLDLDGLTHPYLQHEEVEIRRAMKWFFESTEIIKEGWNAGYFDLMLVERRLECKINRLLDYILVHRCVEPEQPHKLAYAGSVNTDVPAWKSAKTALKAKSLIELEKYCHTDVAVTQRTGRKIWQTATSTLPNGNVDVGHRGQLNALRVHHKVQQIAVGIHRTGMWVDREKVKKYDAKYRAEAIHWLRIIQRIVAEADFTPQPPQAWTGEHTSRCKEYCSNKNHLPVVFNPQSVYHVKELIFDRWGLTPVNFSEAGEPSTDDESCREIVRQPGLSNGQKQFFEALRRFRKAVKIRGTYLRKLIPLEQAIEPDDLADDTEVEEENPRSRSTSKGKSKSHGIIWPDGFFRGDINTHGPSTQRTSASNPNTQNYPRKIRDVVVSPPGLIYIYADFSALELRTATNIWGLQQYIKWFADPNVDSHRETAIRVFGEKFLRASPEHQERLRDFIKRFQYASLYWASLETVHQTITESEDDEGNLMFADFEVRETRLAHSTWLKMHPEIEVGWQRTVDDYDRQGFLVEPVLGFMSGPLDIDEGQDRKNKIVNWVNQAAGAAIAHLAGIEINEQLPHGHAGKGSGIVNYAHDSYLTAVRKEHERMGEVKEKKGKKVQAWCPKDCNCATEQARRVVQKAMTRVVPGHPVPYVSEAKVVEVWC